MKQDNITRLDINTQKKNLLKRLYCSHGGDVLNKMRTYRIHHQITYGVSYLQNEVLYIDSDPAYLFVKEDKGKLLYGVVVSANGEDGSEVAKVLYFDSLDNETEEYDNTLNKTGKKVFAKTEDVHDVFDVISCCQTYLDVWNCIKGKKIRVCSFVNFVGAQFNSANQIDGIRTRKMPVFTFERNNKTSDGKYFGPVKKSIVVQEIFGSPEVEGKTKTIYYYDTFGLLQKVDIYDDNEDVITSFFEYKRNNNGQIIEEIHPDGRSKKYYYGFQNSQKVSKTILFDKDGETREIREFDSHGNLIRETRMYQNKVEDDIIYDYNKRHQLYKMENGTHNYKYIYNSLGQLIEIDKFQTWNNNKLCHTTTFKYSPSGLLIEKNGRGEFVRKTEYLYDELDHLIEEKSYIQNGGCLLIKYKHDRFGNCLLCEVADANGTNVSSRTISEIEYY